MKPSIVAEALLIEEMVPLSVAVVTEEAEGVPRVGGVARRAVLLNTTIAALAAGTETS